MASINNQDVIEKERLEGLIPCCQWIRQISNQTLKDTSVRSSVLFLVKELQNLNKSRSRSWFTEKIDSFKKEPYKFPSVLLTPRNKKSKNNIGDLNANMLIARWLETSFPKFNRHEYYTAVSYFIRLGNFRTFKIIWSSKENMVQFFRNQGQRSKNIFQVEIGAVLHKT